MATRNLVPRGNNEGSLGIDGQRWSALHVASISTDTLKVTNIQLKANDNLSLFTKGAGIEDISTNGNGQFVIAMDDVFLTSLGFNADGTKPDFAANGTVLAGDSFVTAINKLDQAVSNVADPSDLDTTNFTNGVIDTDISNVSAADDTLASAKAIKTYVDAQVTAQDLDFQGDAGGALSIDLDSETLTIAGGTGLTSTGAGQTLTLTLDDTAVTAGAYGSATAIPTFTVDQQGRLTAAGSEAISTKFTLSADSGVDDEFLVGGTLTFAGTQDVVSTTVSNDTITIDLVDTAVTPASYGSATAIPTFTVDQQGRLTAAGTVGITTTLTVDSDNAGTQDVSLADDDLQILGGTGLTSAIAKANNEVTVTMTLDDTAVTPGTYGDANSVSQVTVDQQGRITGASSIDIEIPKGQVTNFDEEVQDLVGAQLATNGTHTGISATYDDNGDGAIDLTVEGLTLARFAGDAIQTKAEIKDGGDLAAGFGDNDTSVLTAAAIKQYIDAQGFGIGSGDISRVNITAGTGLSGSVDTAAGDHTQTLSLSNTGVTNAAEGESFGSSTQVATFTVDQQGRLTAASNSAITIASTSVSDFTEAVEDVTGAQLVTNGTHAGITASYDLDGDGALDLTVSAGTAHIQDAAVTAAKLNTDIISGQTELAAGLEATDELLVSDAGTVKRMDASVLQTYMQNNLTFTTNTDVDVSKANLSTRLASYTSEDTLNIGDADNDTSVVIRGNLTVQGTTTTVDSTTINIQNAFSFEGATDNEFETTLTTIDPTADRTIRLPDQDGFLPVLAVESATKITSTPEELNLLDGASADTVVNEKAVIYSNAGKVRGDLTGNADTATKIADAVNIGGVAFDGSASIDLPGVNTAGNQNTSGNADSATVATNITATANNNTDETVFLTFVDGATGTQGIETDAGLTYNPNSGLLTSTSFSGSLTGNVTGNADTATALATTRSIGLGGDLGGSANFDGTGDITIAATIQAGSVENTMLASDGWSLTLAGVAQEDINLGDALDFNGTANQVSIAYAAENNDLTFSLPATINVDTSGNAATASTWETARTLSLGGDLSGSTSINGSQNVTLTATIAAGSVENTMLASDGWTLRLNNAVQEDINLGDTLDFNGTASQISIAYAAENNDLTFSLPATINVDTSGNAATATELQTARSIGLGGDLGGSANFDGTGDITITATVQAGAIEHGMLAEDIISGQDELAHADIADGDDLMIHDADAAVVKKVGVDSLRDHIFGAVSGDIAVADGGAVTIQTGAVEHSMLAEDIISGQDELAHADIVDADEMMISDAGTIKRVGVDSLRDHFFGAVSGDAAIADGGALTIASAAVEHGMLNDNIISGQDELAHADIVDEDELMISDNGTIKRVGVDSLRDHFFGAVSGDITIADGGTTAIGAQKVTNAMLADDAVGADELAANAVVNASIAANAAIDITKLDVAGAAQLGSATLAQDDDFVVYDTNTTTNKRVAFSNVEDSIFANVSGDATIAAGGALTIAEGAVEYSMIDSNAIKDEDDMASDSASHLATQQSIKKYVDDQLGRFGGIFKTDSSDNSLGANVQYNRDVIFDSSPLVRSHFGPFAFDLGQLVDEGGSDIIFFGPTKTGASDRHFLVIGSTVEGVHTKGDCLFTGASFVAGNEDLQTP